MTKNFPELNIYIEQENKDFKTKQNYKKKETMQIKITVKQMKMRACES